MLEVAGEDRVAFLQGLVSNDVTKAGPDRALYAALLTRAGQIPARFLHRGAAARRSISTARRRGSTICVRRLSLYKLRSKVTLRRCERAFRVAAAWGDGAPARSASPSSRARRGLSPAASPMSIRASRALGVRLCCRAMPATREIAALGFAEADAAAYDRLRLALGVPDGSRDLRSRSRSCSNAGFDELNGIDWQKGCYIGQELTARTKYRALIKKRLLPVAVEGAAAARPDTPVMLGARRRARCVRAATAVALALLRLDAVEKARAGAALTAGGAPRSRRRAGVV